MTAVYGSQNTPRVLMVVSTLKAKHQTLFFLQWLLQRSTKKKTILTIQRVNKYFEQIGHFTCVQSAKIPHVRNERLQILKGVMLLLSPLSKHQQGARDAFTPNKVQGTFYILKGKWGNRIILVSPSPLFNKQICISRMVACESLLAGQQDDCHLFGKTICPSNSFIQVLQMSIAVFICPKLNFTHAHQLSTLRKKR